MYEVVVLGDAARLHRQLTGGESQPRCAVSVVTVPSSSCHIQPQSAVRPPAPTPRAQQAL